MAQRYLDEGQFEAARDAIEKGYERNPTDPQISQMFQQILFAHGVRLARRGRDLRRDGRRGHRRGPLPPDPPEAAEAFQQALGAFDRVLRMNPGHAKAIVMKGATLYRMDRQARRGEVKGLYEEALGFQPDSPELNYALGVVQRECGACDDTGECPTCRGGGQVSALLFRSTCPECRGSGVCTKCAIL